MERLNADTITNKYGTTYYLGDLPEEKKRKLRKQLIKENRRAEILDKIKSTILGIVCTPLNIFFRFLFILSTIAVRISSIGLFYGIYKVYKVYVDLKSGMNFLESPNLESAIILLMLPFLFGILSYIFSFVSDFLELNSF